MCKNNYNNVVVANFLPSEIINLVCNAQRQMKIPNAHTLYAKILNHAIGSYIFYENKNQMWQK